MFIQIFYNDVGFLQSEFMIYQCWYVLIWVEVNQILRWVIFFYVFYFKIDIFFGQYNVDLMVIDVSRIRKQCYY